MKFVGLLLLLFLCPVYAAGPINGVDGPFVSVAEGKLIVTLKLQEASYPKGLTFGITETKKSRVNYLPAPEGGMQLELGLDLDDLQSFDVSEGTDQILPDGRFLPGVPGGVLKNARRIERGQDFITFHSPKSFGIAFPLHWNLSNTRDGHHWLNWKGKNIGMISVVNANKDKKAFGMIFLRYSALRGNKELMNRLKKSRKNNF